MNSKPKSEIINENYNAKLEIPLSKNNEYDNNFLVNFIDTANRSEKKYYQNIDILNKDIVDNI